MVIGYKRFKELITVLVSVVGTKHSDKRSIRAMLIPAHGLWDSLSWQGRQQKLRAAGCIMSTVGRLDIELMHGHPGWPLIYTVQGLPYRQGCFLQLIRVCSDQLSQQRPSLQTLNYTVPHQCDPVFNTNHQNHTLGSFVSLACHLIEVMKQTNWKSIAVLTCNLV